MAVKAKEAVKKASEYFVDLMDGQASGVLLEELSLSRDQHDWEVTLSAWIPERKPPSTAVNPIGELFRSGHAKIYRLFQVDSETGEVKSMKMRKVE
ncbi:MAG: hypothetical protein JST93_25395 [Acidobacteria bacterium]|nr:hypothetical protein [Acidobacteriota bacterium]